MSTPTPAPQGASARRIAVISQLGDAAREAVSIFAGHLGLEPVLLPDTMSDGDDSFVARLDGMRDVAFAIVLLSADDLGEASPSPDPGGVRRALLLEIGFLLGALGRARICFVLAGKPALAAEWDGIARHAMDESGLWRLLLAREMRQAGLDVDMNRAM
jgi:predicted nucleotide-binding protein